VIPPYPAPAPVGPYGAAFSAFNGATPNGTWSLYVFDNGPGDQGSVAGGWSLTVTTVAARGSAGPTISNIPDQATTVNTAMAAIPFTVNDADTPVNNLTLSASSSNPALVPTNNIVFGGSGTNRTVMVTPATNQTGSATITVTVSDGTNSASAPFVLMVNAVNTPPAILSLTGAGTTNVVIQWSAVSNVTYRVQYQPNLNPVNWSNLVPDITASNSTASAIDHPIGAPRRFYRILVVP
jgi:subtilisin-like proprotein convertase family protein